MMTTPSTISGELNFLDIPNSDEFSWNSLDITSKINRTSAVKRSKLTLMKSKFQKLLNLNQFSKSNEIRAVKS